MSVRASKGPAKTAPERSDRAALMVEHVAARARRDAAPLGSPAFRDAAQEVARIEIEIARLEEPAVPAAQ